MKKGDFLIVNRKTKLALVKLLDIEHLLVVLDRGSNNPETTVTETIKHESIVVNLGRTPRIGSVYGVAVEPVLRTIIHTDWGLVRLYKKLEEKEGLALKKCLSWAANKCEEYGVEDLMPLDIEVRQAKGKYQGSFHFRKKLTDIIRLNPDMLDFEVLTHVISHELGHGIWYRKIRPEYVLLWIEAYHRYTSKEVIDNELHGLMLDIIEAKSVSTVLGYIDDEKKDLLKRAMWYIHKVHFLSPSNVEAMLSLGSTISFEEIFPTSLEVGKIKAPLGEYGAKSVEEFFAESVRLKFVGRALPKSLGTLLMDTLSNLDSRLSE
jgi:hypothetical protein